MRAILRWTLAAVLMAPGAARGSVIYDNLGAPVDFGIDSDLGGNNGFVVSADDFTLDPGEIITDIHWTGAHNSSNFSGDDFTIQFFVDVAGSPAIAPFLSLDIDNLEVTDTLTNVFGRDWYSYSAFVDPIILLPSTVYWLSIFNDTTADPNDGWIWGAKSAGDSIVKVRATHEAAWSDCCNFRMDFQLTDDPVPVPEPATLLLFGTGLAAVGVRRYRQRQK